MATPAAPPITVRGHVDDQSTWAGVLLDALEYIPDLIWPLSVTTFNQMRVDPQLAGVLAAYTLPLRRASWAVDPAGVRPEVARTVADDLGLPVIGSDDKPGPARRRGVNWAEHIRAACLQLTFGHMPFELQAEMRDGQARLIGLLERMPTSISAINVNADGSLKSVQQGRAAGQQTDPEILARNLLWYVHDREGSSWQGRSIMRPAFAAWLTKREMQRVLATSNRRFGMGVPSVEAPPGATPAQIAEAQRLASSLRAGDTAGAGLPAGFKLALSGIVGSTPDTLGFINYLDRQMSRMALAGILDLGDSPNGSRALGAEFVDLFLYALQAIADQMAATVTAQAAVRIVDWNWGEDEPAPRVVCGDVGAERQVTAEALNSLLQSGALSSDPALESFVRREWKLPERDPNAPPTALPMPVGTSARKSRRVATAAVSLRRQPTEIETASRADFVSIQQQWTSAVDALVAQWQNDVTPAQVDDLVAQIEAAVRANDVQALSSLTVDSDAGAALLAAAMADLAAQGAQDVVDEAGAQGLDVDAAPVANTDLEPVAAVTASLLGAGLSAAAARAALQQWGPNLSAADVGAAVRDQLATLTDASLSTAVGSALSTAQHTGRVATLDAAPQATYVASEILDSNTCQACLDEDGTEFASLADAEDAYASGGYSGCEGGLRCRGILVAVWSDAAKQAA